MVIKRRKKPLELVVLEALASRIRKNHLSLSKIQKEIATRQKGFSGELKADYFLEQLSNRATILQDVGLQVNGRAVQIDTIIITSYSIYCIEVKNIEGTILFNTRLRQFIQRNGEIEKAFRYPLNQAEHQKLQLQMWLHQRQVKNVPISYFIAISEPSTIIQVKGNEEEIAKLVAHAEIIPTMIKQNDERLRRTRQPALPHRQIGQMILDECVQYKRDILPKYNLLRTDIVDGVKCPHCLEAVMQWNKRVWRCRHCRMHSRNAHIDALDDYFLLINSSITNKQARKFLKVNSRHTVYRLLSNANLNYDSRKRAWRKK